jgi:hypothetical protein
LILKSKTNEKNFIFISGSSIFSLANLITVAQTDATVSLRIQALLLLMTNEGVSPTLRDEFLAVHHLL